MEGTEFDAQSLKKAGVVKKLLDGLKVLGQGDLTRAITVTAANFSASAKEKIEKAGGKAIVIEAKPAAAN